MDYYCEKCCEEFGPEVDGLEILDSECPDCGEMKGAVIEEYPIEEV